jgi:hypothetical protein
VTLFSTRAITRGLAGLLVGMLRQRGVELNPNDAANNRTSFKFSNVNYLITVFSRY